jgi:DNA-binding transcriptional ArsR family regulator
MTEYVCDIMYVHQDKVNKIQKAMEAEGLLLKMSNIFQVRRDPTRLKIILALEMEELCVCDIAALTGLSQSSVSHHLQTLRQTNLVNYRREGKMTIYSLADRHVSVLLTIARDHARERTTYA